MAVFPADAPVGVAEGVTAASLDTLESLVAKQLVVRRDQRLMMLEADLPTLLAVLSWAVAQRRSELALQLLSNTRPTRVIVLVPVGCSTARDSPTLTTATPRSARTMRPAYDSFGPATTPLGRPLTSRI